MDSDTIMSAARYEQERRDLNDKEKRKGPDKLAPMSSLGTMQLATAAALGTTFTMGECQADK